MSKVYLYEDSGGSLYIHKQGDETIYGHVELMVPYGATFDQDAANIAEGVTAGDGVEKVPYSEMEARLLDGEMRRIAVWDDGKIHRFAHPGRDGAEYLQSRHEINPAQENSDLANL